MSINAAALRILVERGLTAADILAVAEAIETHAGPSPAAIRQARYRQRGGGNIPEEMRQAVFERDGFACLECGSADYLQCDHVHPVSRGGETSMENLQTLCRVCNARKKDRIRKRSSGGNSNGDGRGTSGGNSGERARSGPPKENISNPPDPFPNGNGDPEKLLFDSGIAILTAAGLTSETKARSLLGKWKRDHGAPNVITALSAAQREGAIEPVAFIEAALKVRAKQQAPPVWDGMA